MGETYYLLVTAVDRLWVSQRQLEKRSRPTYMEESHVRKDDIPSFARGA